MLDDDTVCPGCGLLAPASTWPVDRRLNASAECWQVAAEVTAFELSYPYLAARFHQLSVDAYGAQHAGRDARSIRVAYSLIGLHLSLDRGLTGAQVRTAHQHLGKPDPSWPAFPPPLDGSKMTILHVAQAGPRRNSLEGYEQAIQQWARSVWQSWAPQQVAVIALTDRVLAPWLLRP